MATRKTKAAAGTATAVVTPAAPVRSEVKGSGTATKAAAIPAVRDITHDMIAKRAYEIYASRGYAPGNPVEDWHEAERQLRAGL